jgi:hypothetical protein
MRKVSIFLILISVSNLTFASDWKREINGRWGFALIYPASLIPEPYPANGGGRNYHSADRQVSLVAFGSHTHPDDQRESLEGSGNKN